LNEKKKKTEVQMRIAISTESGYVSAHFGRCPSYTLVDIEDGKVIKLEEIANPGHSPGFLPNYLSEKGVDTIIAGGMGPRAQGLFAEKKIHAIIGVQGRIDEVIDKFLHQELKAGKDLCDHDQRQSESCGQGEIHREAETGVPAQGIICVTSRGQDLEAEIDPKFGRAMYFLFVNPETLEYEAIKNPYAESAHGAGIQAAQLIVNRKISMILTGQVGPNAQRILDAAGIRIIAAENGSARKALASLKR
jgi:predicted Fe-Mo cluster-binding NifX family protein